MFVISGFWHGASWTFIIWGFYHAILYLITYFVIIKTGITQFAKNRFIYIFQILLTFSLVSFGWIFFRADNLNEALIYINSLYSLSIFSLPNFTNVLKLSSLFFMIAFLILIEWKGKNEPYAIKTIYKNYKLLRWSFYALIVFFIGMFMDTSETPFIYFQF